VFKYVLSLTWLLSATTALANPPQSGSLRAVDRAWKTIGDAEIKVHALRHSTSPLSPEDRREVLDLSNRISELLGSGKPERHCLQVTMARCPDDRCTAAPSKYPALWSLNCVEFTQHGIDLLIRDALGLGDKSRVPFARDRLANLADAYRNSTLQLFFPRNLFERGRLLTDLTEREKALPLQVVLAGEYLVAAWHDNCEKFVDVPGYPKCMAIPIKGDLAREHLEKIEMTFQVLRRAQAELDLLLHRGT
jgi:hypothetical protein